MSCQLKFCRWCNLEKPLTEFTFSKQRNKHVNKCKSCICINTRKWFTKLEESKDPTDMLEITFHKMIMSSRSAAKLRNIPYALSLKNLRDIYQQQNGQCFYTGVPMTLRSNNHLDRDPLLISLDRRDSSIGYTPENTVLCCWGANALKGQHSESTFYTTLKTFYESSLALGKSPQQ